MGLASFHLFYCKIDASGRDPAGDDTKGSRSFDICQSRSTQQEGNCGNASWHIHFSACMHRPMMMSRVEGRGIRGRRVGNSSGRSAVECIPSSLFPERETSRSCSDGGMTLPSIRTVRAWTEEWHRVPPSATPIPPHHALISDKSRHMKIKKGDETCQSTVLACKDAFISGTARY